MLETNICYVKINYVVSYSEVSANEKGGTQITYYFYQRNQTGRVDATCIELLFEFPLRALEISTAFSHNETGLFSNPPIRNLEKGTPCPLAGV